MTAVWVRMRSELRALWRAWLGLSLLVALFFGPARAAALTKPALVLRTE